MLEERRVLAATVTTDLSDYAPGDTSHILASEFAVGETVEFQVLHTDGIPNTGGGHEPWQVTDGVMGDFNGDGTLDGDLDGVADGNIHTTWYVNPDDSADSAFELTAHGLSSGLSASHAFTDSVTFSGSGTVSSSSSSRTSATFSHTIGAGTDRLLLVTVLTDGGEDVSSITYGGVALTQAIERDFGDDEGTAVEIWYLKNPTVGTANIIVNFSSSVDPSYIRADNLTGVDQTTPIGATASNVGDDDDIAVNITTTTANSLIFGAVAMHGGDTDPFATGSGMTERFDSATGTSGDNDIGVWGGFRAAATAATYTVAAEADKDDDWTVAAVEIRMTQAVQENPAINIEKLVNGVDADSATGPILAVGGTATFTYNVTNTGNVALSTISVVDDNGTPAVPGDNFNPTFTGGDTNSNGLLDLGETWTYSATRTVVANLYTNIATASGKSPAATTVSDTDPANYFGAAPSISLVKKVNGDDANAATGPILAAGGTATFTYVVTNNGNTAVGSVVVVDDNGTPGAPGDDFSPALAMGDTNSNGLLDLGETWTYSANRTVVAGQYTNIATVNGSVGATGQVASDTDPANYFGAAPGINIVKKVAGQDANSATGPIIPVGSAIAFTYEVTNAGNIALGSVIVVDDNGTSGSPGDDFNPAYVGGDANTNGLLEFGETWLYSAAHTVVAGQYVNIGSATGSVAATGQSVTDTDPAFHFGKAAPEIQTLAITTPIDENGTATLTGTYTHDGLFSSHQLDIDWDGDGGFDETVTVSGGSFSVPHQFLDDGPTGTASDTHNVNVQLREDPEVDILFGGQQLTVHCSELATYLALAEQAADLDAIFSIQLSMALCDDLLPSGPGSDTGSVSLTVNNVAPEILTLSITSPINENDSATLSGTYTDVGTLDTHELDIDWNGDGIFDQTITVSGGSFSAAKQYLDDDPTGTATDTFHVNVRLRDDDTGSDTASTSLTVNNVAPQLLTLAITGPINENDSATLTGTYTDVGTLDTHELDIDWDGDGIFDQTITVTAGGFLVAKQYLDDQPSGTASDTFNVNVQLRDDDTGADTASTSLTVNNIAPELLTLAITGPINENDSATLSGTYTDVGTLDTHKLDVDWNGDGNFDQTVMVSGGSFSVAHQYLDDEPTGTPSDTLSVSVRLRDDDTGSDTLSANVTVNNVAPEIQTLLVTSPINENDSATLSGTYIDVGTLDTHELDIDWNGDGIFDETISVTGGTFSAGHQFLDDEPTGTPNDTHNINVRLRDDDTGSDTASVALTVNNVAPEILTLSITTPIYAGQSATLSGTYSDVGTLDTHQLDIDWNGDGIYDETIAVAGSSFSVSHLFATPGAVTVKTQLRDDDSGSDTANVALSVRKLPILVIAPDKGNTSTPIVKLVNKDTGQIVSQFLVYESSFLGGVQVAVGDMTGDGIDEIIVAPGQGRVGEVRVFTQQGVELTQFRSQSYGATYKGGIEVAVGDVNGDGKSDIVTVTKHGRPDIRVFYNSYDSSNPNADPIADTANKQFFVYASKFLGGADVIVADMGTFYDGVAYNASGLDGRSEIIVGNGPGMRSTIHVYDVSTTPKIVDTILPLSSAFKGGITLSAARVNSDAISDLIVAAGNGGNSAIEVWSGLTSDAFDVRLAAFSAFDNQSTKNAPVHATALDTDGDGIADLFAAVQGTNGKSNQIRYFSPYGAPQGIQYGFAGPWNIASLDRFDFSLSVTGQHEAAAKDNVYEQLGQESTTTVPAKKAKKLKKKK